MGMGKEMWGPFMESRLAMLCGSLPPPPGKRTPTFPLFRLRGPQNGQSEAPSSFTMTGEGWSCNPVARAHGEAPGPKGGSLELLGHPTATWQSPPEDNQHGGWRQSPHSISRAHRYSQA